MSDEQQGHAGAAGQGGWQPIPRGEYDEGTAFVQLPPELLAHPGVALTGSGTWDPLAATGAGGYTPPTVEAWQQPAPAPAGTPAPEQWPGEWGAPAASYEYEPEQPSHGQLSHEHPLHGQASHEQARESGADPQATAEWAMPFGSATPAEGVPAAGTDQSRPRHSTPAHGTQVYGTPTHGTPVYGAGHGASGDGGPAHDARDSAAHGVPSQGTPAHGTPLYGTAPEGTSGSSAHDAREATAHGTPAHGIPLYGAAPEGTSGSSAHDAREATAHGTPAHGIPLYGAAPEGTSGSSAHDARDSAAHGMPPQGTPAHGTPLYGSAGHGASADGGGTQAHDAREPAAHGTPAHGTPVYGAAGTSGTPLHEDPAGQARAHGHWTVPTSGDGTPDASGGYPAHGPADHHVHDGLHIHTDPHGHGGLHGMDQWQQPAADAGHAWEQPAADAPRADDTGSTGQWSIPVIAEDAPDESGEYTLGAAFPGAAQGVPAADSPAASGTPAPAGPVDAREPFTGRQHPTGVTGTGDTPADAWTPAEEPAEPPAEEDRAYPPGHHEHQAEPAEPAAAPEPEPRAAAEPLTEPAAAAPAGDAGEPRPEPQPEPRPDPLGAPHTEHPCASYVLRVNGTDRPVTDAWIGESLLYVLRERLGLAGAKDGCSQGECGACSVQVDGRLVASCLVPAATAAGAEVRTVEGLATDGCPSDVQRALVDCGAVQCGFCVPGMAMTMHDLLEGNHAPTELETRQAICGNLCRCSGYRGVLDAVRQVVEERAESAAAQEEAQPDADQARIPHQAGPHGGGSGKATA
ncbi:2Fe-2S iron-sulfur cluster-binding protein [Streptomyces sp. NPDC046215]|uniref:2Fe-2S iron-sulfur cluster-binding protein n=1 Tax=Streptomyces sp. NPDC046215 TaxID=3155774 RepID=UPI0033FBAFCB